MRFLTKTHCAEDAVAVSTLSRLSVSVSDFIAFGAATFFRQLQFGPNVARRVPIGRARARSFKRSSFTTFSAFLLFRLRRNISHQSAPNQHFLRGCDPFFCPHSEESLVIPLNIICSPIRRAVPFGGT
ncbi:hypothetical protein ZHAS_00003572 [Anopheles sinensis]|uniref:Uncharacterized protein n=1 Tax=Anopheles sinensis TaxID=74873 RepID=A0A084VEL2_ANOSI|nr:hypothetical protein ZHAS_00003572 [Anopheles sinensis]